LESARILVVDDDDDIRELLQLVLQEKGYIVETAVDGLDAVSHISQNKPHLIVLDLMMPRMTGEELCRAVKSDPALRDIIVFILSAKGDLNTKLECLRLGAEEFVVKPVEMEELVVRVERLLQMAVEWKAVASKPTPPPAPSPHDEDSGLRRNVAKAKYGVYSIESLAGAGGMGHVYKAYDESLDRHAAVKVLSKKWTTSKEFVERFRREAKLIAAINHPGIAHIYTFSEEDGELYFALQWCAGGTLSDLIRKETSLGLLPSLDIVLQCAKGLMAASQKGVVHRDIKPGNIMFDENQRVKIVDFGVAHSKKISDKITVAQEIIGSPAYMAPEQARADQIDHRADIYSLGITFYQMIYGRLPFAANSGVEWVIKHSSEAFPAYDPSAAGVPKRAYEIIERMTRKNPVDRYQSYEDLIKELEELHTKLFSECQLRVPRAIRVDHVARYQNRNFFRLLSDLYRHGESGVLQAEWGPLRKKFLIHHGEVIFFESPQPEENIWRVLAQRSKIRKEEIPFDEQGWELTLNRLLFQQAFTLDEFRASYRELMKAALLQIFVWPVFQGEFHRAEIQHDPFTRIPLSRMLMEGALNWIPYEVIKHQVPDDHFISRTPKFEEVLQILDLPKTESFTASRIEGGRVTMDVLHLLTGFPSEQLGRFIFLLKGFGAVEFSPPTIRKQRKEESRPSAIKPAPERPHETEGQRMEPPEEPTPPQTQPPRENTLRASDPSNPRLPRNVQEMVVIDKEAAEKFFKQAKERYLEKDFWNAGRFCTHAIANNPGVAKYHHLLAMALSRHAHSAKVAEESFSKAIDLDPENADYHVDFAFYLRDRGMLNQALDHCDIALSFAPRHERASKLFKELGGVDV
jgi:serine/threonine protein kinase/ActR/RegA family two-component response regulator